MIESFLELYFTLKTTFCCCLLVCFVSFTSLFPLHNSLSSSKGVVWGCSCSCSFIEVEKMRPRSSYSKWDVILILLLVVVIVVGIVLWISEKEEHANWQEGEWLDVVLACPPSYKVAMLALLKSLSENSRPNSTRIWIFQEDHDNEEKDVLNLLRSEKIFPVENVWFVNYSKSEYLDTLLNKIEEDFDARKIPPPSLLSSSSDIPQEETKARNHQLLVDQHNYIRFYIPSIFNNLPSLSPSSFSSSPSYPPKPKQFLYLDCDMIAVRDPIILMHKVAPHLGRPELDEEEKIRSQRSERAKEEKEVEIGEEVRDRRMCLAAAERDDPLLVDSLGRGDEAQKIVEELGINSELKSFNAGMLVIDTDCWHETQALQRILFWMELRTQRPIYQKGSQPPLLLSFIPQGSTVAPSELYPRPMEYYVVGDEWDFQARNLGETNARVGIIHYNGKKKPWQFIVEDEIQQDTWEKYAIPSLLPPDRPVTAPDETSAEKVERRKGELRREIDRKRRILEREKIKIQEREERQIRRQLEKEEREKLRELIKQQKERRKELEKQRRQEEKEEEKLGKQRWKDMEKETEKERREYRKRVWQGREVQQQEKEKWKIRGEPIWSLLGWETPEQEKRRKRRAHLDSVFSN